MRLGKGMAGVVLLLATGCAAAPAARPAVASAGAPARPIELAPVVVSPYTDAELAARFERAREALLADEYRVAADAVDQLVRLAPEGRTAPPSLYDAGVAREALGEPDAALARYDELLRRFPDDVMARSASLRRARLDAFVERWPRVAEEARAIEAWPNLTVLESIEARGLHALALAEEDRLDDAEKLVMRARDDIEQNRLGEAGKPPVEVATVSFALGEIRKKRSETITFQPVPKNFGDVLERRCTGLLDAQRAYTDAMRALDAHWSAMAGYRIGQLYQQLHRDVMGVPPPSNADTLKKKQLFEGAMRLRYRVLLEKGLKMMDGTVKMGERTGESSAWIARAREARREIELALADEKAAMAKLPYSEEELKEALDRLVK